jgi:pimeloyl-ACP methyl ester carboxylesterase
VIGLLLAATLTLQTPTGAVHGTLLVPQSEKPVPVVLIIAGSGPTDRDGNSGLLFGKNNSLKMLAEGLEANGVASLRYDKRGIAASRAAGRSESELRFDTYVDDAAAWVRELRKDARFSSVAIAGHSEGSLIGIVAAQRGGVDRFVSIAGSGQRASDLLLKQLAPQLPPELMKRTREIMASLQEGKTVADPPEDLAALFRPSVQPYLISWFKYDPAQEIAKLKIPVLVIQGTTDIQIPVDDAKRLSAKPVVIEGMNHVLKDVAADNDAQTKSYSDPALPVNAKLIAEIVKFVK